MYPVHTSGMGKPLIAKRKASELTFWERLKEASEWGGIPCSPSQVATELSINPSAVSKYVDGKFPKKENINALAKRRGVRSEWLLSGLGEMVAEEALDAETLELLKIFRALPEDAKQRLLVNARYESTATTAITTGKREVLTEELIRLLEQHRRQ